MPRKIKKIKDVVDWGLCTGCGACISACDKGAVSLINIASIGIRPLFNENICSVCKEYKKCLSICPGYNLDANMEIDSRNKTSEANSEFGLTLEIWEGCAVDKEIRYNGSSGGILSALALYCLEKENMNFVLHTGMDTKYPWLSKTYQSRSRKEILARTGSRYTQASPCEDLKSIRDSNGQCVFIGKPCDTAGVSMLRRQNQKIDRNLGLVLSFFCAAAPSTQGTLDLIKSMDIPLEKTNMVRYRGEGWPGRFKVLYDNNMKECSLSYEESWGKLNKYSGFRCRICPDGLGRFADISCGDAWHRYSESNDSGRSIILVRTRKGQEILHRAMAAEYIELKRITTQEVISAQENLLSKRKQLFGRLFAMKLMLIPTPEFRGFLLFRNWLRLPFITKFRTIFGTFKRLITRKLWYHRDFSKYISIQSDIYYKKVKQ